MPYLNKAIATYMPWNTTSVPTDLERIRRALQVPAEKAYLDILRSSMARVEIDLPEAIATAQDILDKLDTNRSDRETFSRSDKGALKKADVLEWDTAQKGGGISELKQELIQELADILHVQIQGSGGVGSAYLARS